MGFLDSLRPLDSYEELTRQVTELDSIGVLPSDAVLDTRSVSVDELFDPKSDVTHLIERLRLCAGAIIDGVPYNREAGMAIAATQLGFNDVDTVRSVAAFVEPGMFGVVRVMANPVVVEEGPQTNAWYGHYGSFDQRILTPTPAGLTVEFLDCSLPGQPELKTQRFAGRCATVIEQAIRDLKGLPTSAREILERVPTLDYWAAKKNVS